MAHRHNPADTAARPHNMEGMREGTEQATIELGHTRPEQYLAIREILDNTRMYRNAFLSVCGIVTNIQPAAMSRGTDLQLTFALADLDGTTVKVKFFRKEMMELPWVRREGDVVFLRNIKVTLFSGQIVLISNVQTEFNVFPKEWIYEPWYRQLYMTDLIEQASSSSGTYVLEPHLQQWAITLRSKYKTVYPDEFPKHRPDGPAMADAPENTTTNMHDSTSIKRPNTVHAIATPQFATTVHAQPGPSTFTNEAPTSSTGTTNKPNNVTTSRNKFSAIKDIEIKGSGSFYDLVGEVVKLFYSVRNDITELYITDYTENSILRDQQPEDFNFSSQSSSTFPLGCRTLKVDLFSPHSYWANQNISVGHYVFLKNVRVKWSSNGEAEGSVWKDGTYPDRLGVFLLSQSDPRWDTLVQQKKIYSAGASSTSTNTVEKLSKNKKRRLRREKEKLAKEKLENMRGNELQDSDEDITRTIAELKPAAPPRWNPYIVVNVGQSSKLSSLHEIVHNPNRTVNGHELPFINVNHRARLAVVDYWPHNLKDFTSLSKDAKWAWRFWLVVKDAGDKEGFLHNIEVAGSQAETLLKMRPQDLGGRTGEKSLRKLQEKMFILWGDLHEKKEKFFAAHPHIRPDVEFQATKYNIVADNLPFEAGVMEYGKKTVRPDSASEEYIFVHRLFATEIKA